MPVVCTCPPSALCDACRAAALGHLQGVARARGQWLAESVARRCPGDRPWPAYEGRTREIALAKVADLTGDPRLREALAEDLGREAARWWRRITELP